MPSLYLYRVNVISYPTPDGNPFDWGSNQDHLQEIIDNYFDPSCAPDFVMPAWVPNDFEEWVWQEDSSGYSSNYQQPPRIGKYVPTGPPLNVPIERRKHWLSRASAKKYAQGFIDWGCEVEFIRSAPVEWDDSTRTTTNETKD